MRTSDRLFTEIPIIISGTDPAGAKFVENTQALVLSRRGARIISNQALVPQQKINIRCVKTGLDALAQVIGPITGAEAGCHFGVTFVEPEVNIWGIHFPVLDGTEKPAGRLVLECADCQAQEVVHLDLMELEVFVANQSLIRPCPQCKGPTLWMQSASGKDSIPAAAAPHAPHTQPEAKKESTSPGVATPFAPHTQPEAKKESTSPGAAIPLAPHTQPEAKKESTSPGAATPLAPHTQPEAKKESTSPGAATPLAPHTQPEAKKESTSPGAAAPHVFHTLPEGKTSFEAAAPPSVHRSLERQSPRKNLHVEVCLRHSEFGQEVVTSENISLGGFRVKSGKDYPVGTVVEAALPYKSGGANVFAPARLVYKAEESGSPQDGDSTPPARISPGPPKTP